MGINKVWDRMKFHPRFYLFWSVIVTGLVTFVFEYVAFRHLSSTQRVIWPVIGALSILAPVLFFNELYWKLIVSTFAYGAVSNFLLRSLDVELDAIGYAVILFASLLILAGLVVVEHYKSTRSFVSFFVILCLVVGALILYVRAVNNYSEKYKTLNKISMGEYSSVNSAINTCESFKEDKLRNGCFSDLAISAKRPDICEKLVEIPDLPYKRSEYVQGCLNNIKLT